MAATHPPNRKRPVNLTLSQSVVNDAKQFSSNLSATVEELLTGYVAAQKLSRERKLAEVRAMMDELNELHDRFGSFADDHSPL